MKQALFILLLSTLLLPACKKKDPPAPKPRLENIIAGEWTVAALSTDANGNGHRDLNEGITVGIQTIYTFNNDQSGTVLFDDAFLRFNWQITSDSFLTLQFDGNEIDYKVDVQAEKFIILEHITDAEGTGTKNWTDLMKQ